MNWVRHIAFSLLALWLHACTQPEAPDCISKLGEPTTQLRAVEDFVAVSTFGRVHVLLVPDSTDFVEVEHGAAVIDRVTTSVEDGVLFIRDDARCKWVRNQSEWPTVTVHFSHLRHIQCESAGDVRTAAAMVQSKLEVDCFDATGSLSLEFMGDSLLFRSHTGAMDVRLSGATQHGYFYSGAYAPLDASELICETAIPHSAGTGDISVRATKAVYYQLFDWGNIRVHGSPDLIEAWHHEGTGQLIRVE